MTDRPPAQPASHRDIVATLEGLAASTDRAVLEQYGESVRGRKLLCVTVSSPANLARRDEYRAALTAFPQQRAKDPKHRIPPAQPLMVWMGFGIHGNEISGPDAALALARRLCTDTSREIQELLENLVIHIDVSANPDGRERYLAHLDTYSRSARAEDLQDVLHDPPWPRGRGNAYFFDLNRDAVFTTQPESRARVSAVVRACPQLYVDVHEMAHDDTYLFAVPAEPLNPHLPRGVHESWDQVGADMGRAFDEQGASYYTRSWNEVFYPGFFDIWPAYRGAVPFLYEQAATSGTSVLLPNGKVRTYQQAVDNQLLCAFATLRSAVAHRADIVRRWEESQVGHLAADAPDTTWLVLPTDAYKSARILELLLRQGIRVERLAKATVAGGEKAPLPEGTLRIDVKQPLAALVRNILDTDVPLGEAFLKRERQGLDLGSRTLLFDVTAWSLPLAFAADIRQTKAAPAGDWQAVQAAAPRKASGISRSQPRFGYLLDDPSLHATARLLHQGVKLRVATEALSSGERDWPPGTLLIRAEDQQGDVTEALERVLTDAHATAVSIDTPRVSEGPDLGGPEFRLLSALRIALLTGAPFTAESVGALWHLFDASIGVSATLLDFRALTVAKLSSYDVIMLPDGVPEDLLRVLRDDALARLRHWVDVGGTVVAVAGAALALARAELGSARTRSQVMDRFPPPEIEKSAAEDWFGGMPDANGRRALTAEHFRRYLPKGAYLRADLRPMHWLRYGCADCLPVLAREPDALIAGDRAEVVGRYAAVNQLALSGLVWPEAKAYLAGTTWLSRERLGAGQLVQFASDPTFRGYSLGTQRLLLNAVLFGPAFADT